MTAERILAVRGAAGWQYTDDGIAEMVPWVAGLGCGPFSWLWGRGATFNASGDELIDAAAGYSSRMRADPSDYNRFQYACRVPAMRQAEMVARWLNAPRPSWEPPR